MLFARTIGDSMLRSLVLWGASTSVAWGFCGTYVGGAGSSLYNGASQIAVVRQGTQTTLTMANDVFGSGDLSEFALVVPVPEVLGPDDGRLSTQASLMSSTDIPLLGWCRTPATTSCMTTRQTSTRLRMAPRVEAEVLTA